MQDPPEMCLLEPCEQFGECRGFDGGHLLSAMHPGESNCMPNAGQLSNSCARLTLVLDPHAMPPGTHVHTVCAGLRAAWADRYAHASIVPPVILCGLSGANYTIEVTLVSIFPFLEVLQKSLLSTAGTNESFFVCVLQSYGEEGSRENIELTAKKLSELVRRKLTPVTALAAVVEVKVHTLLVNPAAGEINGSN